VPLINTALSSACPALSVCSSSTVTKSKARPTDEFGFIKRVVLREGFSAPPTRIGDEPANAHLVSSAELGQPQTPTPPNASQIQRCDRTGGAEAFVSGNSVPPSSCLGGDEPQMSDSCRADLFTGNTSRCQEVGELVHGTVREAGRGSVRGVVVNFVTNGGGTDAERDALSSVAESLMAQPGVLGVAQSVSASGGGAPVDTVWVLRGQGDVFAVVRDIAYRVSTGAFFQVNDQQCDVLYGVVVKGARLHGGETVLDLYCGGGGIALQLARECERVVGVEVVQAAVEDARQNASLNGATNVRFFAKDLRGRRGEASNGRGLKSWLGGIGADVAVVDPARAGLSDVVRCFIRDDAALKRVVYVSCNSETMCRDVKVICSTGAWEVSEVQGVDMFPQTDHLETVTILERPRVW
jgi:hypothetical protein